MHDRCGTTFLFLVMFISIILFALLGWLLDAYITTPSPALNRLILFLIRLAMLPVVAGVSYEVLKLLARVQSPLVFPLKAPGYLLQKLTTREPDDKMIECAIMAFEKVLDMDKDPESPEKTFVTETKLTKLSEMMKARFAHKGIEEADAEWILSLTLNIPRSALKSERVITQKECGKILALFEERLTGRPLWYIIGNTDFYGYSIKVDERVLIPRPETEVLVQQAVNALTDGDKVLDLCTGSGAVAVAVACEAAKDKNITMIAADISEEALEVARENVRLNKANVMLVKSDHGEPAIYQDGGDRTSSTGSARFRAQTCARRRRGRTLVLSQDRRKGAKVSRARGDAHDGVRRRTGARNFEDLLEVRLCDRRKGLGRKGAGRQDCLLKCKKN